MEPLWGMFWRGKSELARKDMRGVMESPASPDPVSAVPQGPNILPSLVELLEGVRKELDADRDTARTLLTRAASLIRVEIDRQAVGKASEPKSGGLAGWQVRRLNAFIEARLDQSIRVEELSAVSKLSAAYFSRAFKRTFRESPHQHLVRRRLEKAQSLMLRSELSLSEIALHCGFSDQAHLCKLFRRQYGQTPAAWRREQTEPGLGEVERDRLPVPLVKVC